MKLHAITVVLRSRGSRMLRLLALLIPGLLTGVCEAQTRTEISFWHAMDGQLGEAVGELVKQFNQGQEAFEVKAVYKGSYYEVQAAAMAAYRSKAQPGIVQVAEVGTLSMMLSDAIVPVQRLMRQHQMEPRWSDFVDTISNYYEKDDRLLSMPFNASTAVLYFNKEIFSKAGLGDKPPATWPAVEAAARKILSSGAASCGFTASWPSWTMLENTFAWHDQAFATNQNGYSGIDTKLLINTDFGRMHVAALARWQKEKIFAYGGRLDTPDARFISGECAMLIQSSANIGGFRKTIRFDWGTGQLPHWGRPYPKANSTLGGATLWVMRGHDATHYKGIAQFLKFVADTPQQSWWAATTGYLPITQSAIKELTDSDFYRQNPQQWTGMSQLLNAKPTLAGRGLRLGNYVQVREAIETELENILAGKKTVQEGLDAAVLRGNAILRQFSVTHGAAGQGEI